MGNMKLVPVKPGEEELLCTLIKELAEFEGLAHEVVAKPADITRWLFEKKTVFADFVQVDGEVAGYALYFFNFSTFMGRGGLYLEDIYIRPAYRGCGYGREIFSQMAKIAVENKCARMEWVCLQNNEKAAGFYKKMGAQTQEQWVIHRLEQPQFEQLAQEGQK